MGFLKRILNLFLPKQTRQSVCCVPADGQVFSLPSKDGRLKGFKLKTCHRVKKVWRLEKQLQHEGLVPAGREWQEAFLRAFSTSRGNGKLPIAFVGGEPCQDHDGVKYFPVLVPIDGGWGPGLRRLIAADENEFRVLVFAP